jgi:hypothetical protein
MKYGFVGYAPDADHTQSGVIVDCNNLIPSLRGMKSAPSPVASTLPALAAACRGAASLRRLDGATRVFAGTGTKLYEAGSGSWTDRTRVVGGDYALATTDRWRFAQYGNVSLAVAKTDILQFSSSGAFANVGASVPKAAIVETVGLFVFLFNTNESSFGDQPDRWWCSAIGDYTDWTPSIVTQSATARLVSSSGKIVGARKFGDHIVAYKDNAMYVGVYVGPPVIWDFREIPGRIGSISHEAIAVVGTPDNPRHIFMGLDNFYSFDGSRPIPIGNNRVKEQVFGNINRSKIESSIALHDATNSLVYFWYPVVDSVNPSHCVVYNYRTDKWGRSDRQIEHAFEYTQPSLTYEDVGSMFSTYGDIQDLTYGSSYWIEGYATPAIFNTSHVLQTLNGNSGPSSLTTGDIGGDEVSVFLKRVTPRYLIAPTSASMTNYYRMAIGDSLATDQTVNESRGRFDVMREAGWHRLQLDFNGNVELPGLMIEAEAGGLE